MAHDGLAPLSGRSGRLLAGPLRLLDVVAGDPRAHEQKLQGQERPIIRRQMSFRPHSTSQRKSRSQARVKAPGNSLALSSGGGCQFPVWQDPGGRPVAMCPLTGGPRGWRRSYVVRCLVVRGRRRASPRRTPSFSWPGVCPQQSVRGQNSPLSGAPSAPRSAAVTVSEPGRLYKVGIITAPTVQKTRGIQK